MISREAFLGAARAVEAGVEARRRYYRRLFYAGALLAVPLLAAGLFYGRPLLEWMAAQLGRAEPVSGWEVASFGFFSVVGTLVMVLTPVFRFQGSFRQEFALHRRVLQQICALLGELDIVPEGTEYQYQVRASGLFPSNAGIAERAGVFGRVGNGRFWIQEMAVSHGEGQTSFYGVVLHASICNSNGYHNKPRAFEQYVISPDGIADMPVKAAVALDWQKAAQGLILCRICWDQRLLLTLASLYNYLTRIFLSRSERLELLAEKEYGESFQLAPDMVNIHKGGQAGCAHHDRFLRLAHGEGGTYIALPLCCELFTRLSLFAPAGTLQKAVFLYDSLEIVLRLIAPAPESV